MALSRITAASIADGTVVAADIADGAVTGPKLGATSINANNIVDSSITSAKIVSVANTQITGNITSSQIVPDPVFNGNTTVTNLIVGAGSNTAPSIAPTGDTNTGIFFPAADNIGFATNGVIRGRWTTDGLCFGSDTAAANALDDYEEGTWTPTIAFGGNAVGVTYANQKGNYTKIGNRVFISMYLQLTNKGSSSGSVTISGLPFTSVNTTNQFNNTPLWINGASSISGSMQGYNQANTSTITEMGFAGTGSQTILNNTHCTNNTDFMINFSYSI